MPKYSPSTTCIYPDDFRGVLPSDAIEVTESDQLDIHNARMARTIISVVDGKLAYTPQPQVLAEVKARAAWIPYREEAKAALVKSDTVVLRCFEAGVPLPVQWAEYRKALRAIAGAESGDSTQPLPIQPGYPAGT